MSASVRTPAWIWVIWRVTPGRRRCVGAALVLEVDDGMLEARQHLARQLGARPPLEQQRVASGVQAGDAFAVRQVAGHEGRYLDHEVGIGPRQQQVVQQGLADHV
jgi:hypothetical protein